jgi:hypothetical protein
MASSEESTLKTEFVKQCRGMGWYARRIEDKFAVGILDITVVPKGKPTLFIEAKIIEGLKFAPTDRQYVEGARIFNAQGHAIAVLIGWRNERMYIANNWSKEGALIANAFMQPVHTNYAQALGVWLDGKQSNRS